MNEAAKNLSIAPQNLPCRVVSKYFALLYSTVQTVQNCFLMLRKMEHAKCNNEKRTKNIVNNWNTDAAITLVFCCCCIKNDTTIHCTLYSRELKICYCARSAPLTQNALEFHNKSSNQLVIVWTRRKFTEKEITTMERRTNASQIRFEICN